MREMLRGRKSVQGVRLFWISGSTRVRIQMHTGKEMKSWKRTEKSPSSGDVYKRQGQDLFGGIIGLSFAGKRISGRGWGEDELYGLHPVTWEDVKLKAVPYAFWNNRGAGEMVVWMKELYKM